MKRREEKEKEEQTWNLLKVNRGVKLLAHFRRYSLKKENALWDLQHPFQLKSKGLDECGELR